MADTQNPLHDALSEEYAKYMLHSRQEIGQILRALQKQNEIVTAYFQHGQSFILTAVLDVAIDAGYVILDCGPDEASNQRALASNKFTFVSNQNRIKVQFSVQKLESCQFQGRPAFRVPFPKTMLKLQRREYYRLEIPIREPMPCILPDVDGQRIETEAVDVSVGGIALGGIAEDSPIKKGMLIADCRITIPQEGVVVTTLEVRNLQKISRPNGSTDFRIGCAFVGIPAPHQAMIQRYIIRVDRERRALVRGS